MDKAATHGGESSQSVTKFYFKLVATMIFWGGTFISGRLLAGHVSPFSAAFLRFAIAGAILLSIVFFRNRRLPAIPRGLRAHVILLGLTGVFSYNLLFFWGLQSIDAGRAAVIVATNPMFIALLATVLFGEQLGWINALGVLISIGGALMVITKGNPGGLFVGEFGRGDLLISGCVVSWVAFSLIGKKVITRMRPLTTIAYAATAGTVLLFFPAVFNGLFDELGAYTWWDWGNIGYLGIFGTVLGFVWYYEGIEKIGAARASLFINFVPISAILLSFFLLGESITWSLLAGTILVLSGVYLTNNGLPVLKKQIIS